MTTRTPRKTLLQTILSLVAFLPLVLAAAPALADGFIYIPIPPPHPVPPPYPRPIVMPVPRPQFPLQVTRHRVEVKIDDSVAHTRVDETFYNPNSAQLEGTYIFPLPAGASITRFAMLIGGKEVSGEVIEKEKARRIYEDIVRQSRDPGLLEFVERGLFRARVFPIPPIGNVDVRVEYDEAIGVTGGSGRYRYPLNTGKYSAGDYRDVLVDITLRTAAPLRGVTCLSHPASITRNGDREARVVFEARTLTADKDLVLDWNVGDDALAPVLLTQRTHEPDGFFFITIAPRPEKPKAAPPKDLVAVIDTSGSMLGPKMDEARKALRTFVNGLRPGDRFGIVDFSTEARRFREGLVEANDANRAQAMAYIDAMEARGGTNIEEALRLGLGALDAAGGDERLKMVVLITDGEPTVGLTRPEDIVRSVKGANAKGRRVFAFGVGVDLNAQLLERLAAENHGALDYVLPGENLEVKLSAFWDKIDFPVLTDIRIEFPNQAVTDVYPKPLPDLFRGETLAVTGRYREDGPRQVVLRGKFQGEERVFEYTLDFAPGKGPGGVTGGNDFIARIWATRKIGYLLEAMRLSGESKEVRDEVIRLSQQYGILTPYTSYLILEESRRYAAAPAPGLGGAGGGAGTWAFPAADALRGGAARDRLADGAPSAPAGAVPAEEAEVRSRAEYARKAFGADTGASGVEGGRSIERLKLAGAAAPAKRSGDRHSLGAPLSEGVDKEDVVSLLNRSGKKVQQVGARAFYLQGDRWVEGGLTEKDLSSPRRIAYLSDEYFDLAAKSPGIGELLGVGEKVTFRWKGETILVE